MRNIPLVLAAVLLQGCVPNRFSGYAPSGSGSLEGGYCVAGIKDHLRVHADAGVDIVVRAGENTRNNTITLDIGLVVPDGTTAQFRSPDLLLHSPEWTEPHTLSIYGITASPRREFGPTDILPGSSRESMGHFLLWFQPGYKGYLFETGIPKVKKFTLDLPLLSINGKEYRMDTVAFDAYKEWGIYTCVQ